MTTGAGVAAGALELRPRESRRRPILWRLRQPLQRTISDPKGSHSNPNSKPLRLPKQVSKPCFHPLQ
jgi:hypothetical protein